MSTNISAKDVSTEKQDSTEIEEFLVERYESLYFRFYLSNFIFRIFLFITIIFLISLILYVYKNPDLWSSVEKVLVVFSTFVALFSMVAHIRFRNFSWANFKGKTNELEDKIVKEILRERFGLSDLSKGEIEDFYIELNNLTKAKYDTAFKFYTYEFYIYTIISSLIAGFFIFRIL